MNQPIVRRGMAFVAILGFVALAIVALGIVYYVAASVDNNATLEEEAGDIEEALSSIPDETLESETAPREDSLEADYQGSVLAGNSSKLLDFVQADYDKATASGKLVVLYFYANWCPICKAEFPSMRAAFNALTSEDVVGFRVNYRDDATDTTEAALARAFGVGYQHTKIFLRNGKRILKAPDSWSAERYVEEIQRALGEV